jgi:hypothetical protein
MSTAIEKWEKFIDEAIELELIISELYLAFHYKFSEDSQFWWKLSIEEKNHASILKNLKFLAGIINKAPEEFIFHFDDSITNTIRKVEIAIEATEKEFTRQDTFLIACDIENSNGEYRYQKFCENNDLSPEFRIFQKLNKSDKDHLKRIKKYMAENQIG